MTDDVRRFRRIVVGDAAPETPAIFSDGPIEDFRTDPARPGFAMTRIWVTEDTPAPVKGVRDSRRTTDLSAVSSSYRPTRSG